MQMQSHIQTAEIILSAFEPLCSKVSPKRLPIKPPRIESTIPVFIFPFETAIKATMLIITIHGKRKPLNRTASINKTPVTVRKGS